MYEKIVRIACIVAIVVLAAALFCGLVYTFIVGYKAGNAWPLYVYVVMLLVFGWDNIYGTFRWLVGRAFSK